MKRLILVGGGHAHLFVLEAWVRQRMPGVELVMVTPLRLAPYSGMMPGVIAGHYTYEQACIDLEPLGRAAGCLLLPGRVVAIDLARRAVDCADGSRLEYDVLCLDTGSTPDTRRVAGAADCAVPMKPIERFLAGWQAFRSRTDPGRRRFAVVGAGAAGVEVLLAMRYQMSIESPSEECEYILVSDTPRIMPALNEKAAVRARRLLAEYGVKVLTGSPVTRVGAGELIVGAGDRIEADFIVWATGAAAPDWPRAAGLAVDGRGFVLVDDSLRSVSHPEVFAAGDVATNEIAPCPKSGVYAVRAGPVLARNLRAAMEGRLLERWKPQRRALVLMSTGQRHAMGIWGPLVWEGDWVWRWKDRIDRRFTRRFSEPYRTR